MPDRIQLKFSAGIGWVSEAIRWRTWGPWSHVDICLDDGQLVGALEGRGGVVLHDGTKAKRVMRVTVPVPEGGRGLNFAVGQVGKGYDYAACIGGFMFRADWMDNHDKWFCSELAAATLIHSGLREPLVGSTNRISPSGLVQMLSWVPGIVVQDS